MKKFLLGLGALASVAAPVAAVISCNDKTPKKSADQISVDKIKAMFADFAIKTAKEKAAVAAKTNFDKDAIKAIGTVVTPTGFMFPNTLDGVSMSFELEEIKAEEKTYSGTITFIKNEVTETQTFIVNKVSQAEMDKANVDKAMELLKGVSGEGEFEIDAVASATTLTEKTFEDAKILLVKDNDYPTWNNLVVEGVEYEYTIPNDITVPTTGTKSNKGKMMITVKMGSVTDSFDLSIDVYEPHYYEIKLIIESLKEDDFKDKKIDGTNYKFEVLPSTITEKNLHDVINVIEGNLTHFVEADITELTADDANGTLKFTIGSDATMKKEYTLSGFRTTTTKALDLQTTLDKFINVKSTHNAATLALLTATYVSAEDLGITTPELPEGVIVTYTVKTTIDASGKMVVIVELSKNDTLVENNTKEITITASDK